MSTIIDLLLVGYCMANGCQLSISMVKRPTPIIGKSADYLLVIGIGTSIFNHLIRTLSCLYLKMINNLEHPYTFSELINYRTKSLQ